MTEAKHTEGPWRLIHTYDIDRKTLEKCNHRYGVQMRDAGGFVLHEGANPKANASLIAAAPELYEALDELSRHVQFIVGIAPHYSEMAEAALKKARG
jgi:hypothetical protein